MNTFAQTVDVLHRGMSATLVRHAVIANNVANAETPGFKRSTVAFESELRRVLDSQRQRPALELTRTNPMHFNNHRERDVRDVQIRRVVDFTSVYGNNGNNVDPEQEFVLMVKNQMTNLLLARSIDFEFGQVNRVLRG